MSQHFTIYKGPLHSSLDPGRKDRKGLMSPAAGKEARKSPAGFGTGQSAPSFPILCL